MSFEVGLVLGILIGAGAAGIFVWRSATAGAEEWVRDHARPPGLGGDDSLTGSGEPPRRGE